jgi:hypothetical protein
MVNIGRGGDAHSQIIYFNRFIGNAGGEAWYFSLRRAALARLLLQIVGGEQSKRHRVTVAESERDRSNTTGKALSNR